MGHKDPERDEERGHGGATLHSPTAALRGNPESPDFGSDRKEATEAEAKRPNSQS